MFLSQKLPLNPVTKSDAKNGAKFSKNGWNKNHEWIQQDFSKKKFKI